MESTSSKDMVKFSSGFAPGIPLEESEAAGGVVYSGKNAALSPYGRPVGWSGLSRVKKVAGKLMQLVGEKLAAIGSGNVVLNHNNTVWFVGSGQVFVDDPDTPIGTASSQLQVKIATGDVYQAGLPAPDAPTVEIATDANGGAIAGTLTGSVVATVTRVRTVTGSSIAPGESPESPTSVALEFKGGKARVRFARALTSIAQDAWGLYFTKPSLSGLGRRQLLRYVYEDELSDPVSASLGLAAGDGATTTFGATTAASLKSRNVAVAVASLGASPPTSRGTNIFAVSATSATVARITGMLDGEYQLVSLAIKQVHSVSNFEGNGGALVPAITGAVTYLGGLLNDATQIELEVLNATDFRWRRGTDAWATLTISTAPTALGATGLYVAWSSAAAAAAEQSNKYFVTPFTVSPPAGWTAVKMAASSADIFVMIVYGALVNAADVNYVWSFGASVMANVATIGLTGNNATPVASSASSAVTGLTHNIVFGAAPATSDCVVAFFGSETPDAFTLSAPLTSAAAANLDTRYVDVDFTGDDLLDIFPPKSEEVDAPPAATHVVPWGQYMILLGTLDGTGVTPSLPGRFELYSIASSSYLTPREPLIRVDVRPQDGMVFMWTRSSVQQLVDGDQDTPVLARALVSNRGIANENAAVVTDAGAYGYDSDGGLYFLSNYREMNTSFVTPVQDFIRKNFRPDETTLGFDLVTRALHICNGRIMMLYYEKEQSWSTPIYVDDFLHFLDGDLDDVRIVSAATAGGKLYLSIGNETLGYQAYEVNKGVGTDWNVQTAPRYADFRNYEKTIRKIRLHADFNSSANLDWHSGVNAVASMSKLRGTGADGSIIGDVVIPLRQCAAGGIAWEFSCVAGRANSSYLFSDYDELFTSLDASTALLAVSFTSSSLVLTKEGVPQAYAPNLVAGDLLRIEYRTDKTWSVTRLRGGIKISTFNCGALATVPTSIGIKALLVDAAARLDLGTIKKSNPVGGVRLYRESESAAFFGRSVQAAGDKFYEWARLNIRRCISYRCEVFGDAVGQKPIDLLIKSTVIPIEKTSP